MIKRVALSVPFPGVSRVLEEGEKLGLWEFITLDGSPVKIPDADQYILGGYTEGYDYLIRLLSNWSKSIGILWTSSAGELDLEPIEKEYLDRMLKDERVKFIWFGDPVLGTMFRKGFCAPYPIKIQMQDVLPKRDIVTLWCPATLKKNILNQLVAISLIQRTADVELHTNVPLPKFSFPLKVQSYSSWLPRDELNALIASARLNFAVSYAETFNYQVAEAAMLGTPSIVSQAIRWIKFPVINPNDPDEIADMGVKLLKNPEVHLLMCRKGLLDYFDLESLTSSLDKFL